MKHRWHFVALAWAIALAAAFSCAGPRVHRIATDDFKPLAPSDRVDVYVGKLDPPFTEIAQIDSGAYSYVTDAIKERQLNELRQKARALGANALDQTRILSMQVQSVTMDEDAPVNAWKQGRYQLYFMRARALLRAPDEPSGLDEARPAKGWQVERLKTPEKLDAARLVTLSALENDMLTSRAATRDGATSKTASAMASTTSFTAPPVEPPAPSLAKPANATATTGATATGNAATLTKR